MNKLTLALLLGSLVYVNACNTCGGKKPPSDNNGGDDGQVGAPSPYNVWEDFASRWQDIQDRLSALTQNVTDIQDMIDGVVDDGENLGDALDSLQDDLD